MFGKFFKGLILSTEPSAEWNRSGCIALRQAITSLIVQDSNFKYRLSLPILYGKQWYSYDKDNLHLLKEVPLLKFHGSLRLYRFSKTEFELVLSNSTHIPKFEHSYSKFLVELLDQLQPETLRHPRSADFDYQSKDWLQWVSFRNELEIDLHKEVWRSTAHFQVHGKFFSASQWIEIIQQHSKKLNPLNDEKVILRRFNKIFRNQK